MFCAGILQHDGAVAVLHQLADTGVHRPSRHVGGVDLNALVVVDLEGIGQREAALLLRQVDIEEFALRTAAELLGVHPHLMGDARLVLRAARPPHLCHTRTSSSYGSDVSISRGTMARI